MTEVALCWGTPQLKAAAATVGVGVGIGVGVGVGIGADPGGLREPPVVEPEPAAALEFEVEEPAGEASLPEHPVIKNAAASAARQCNRIVMRCVSFHTILSCRG